MKNIAIYPSLVPLSEQKREDCMKDAAFGKVFTEHMAIAHYNNQTGWGDLSIRPRQNFTIDPANATLHYAQEIFEGMKAYRTVKNTIVLFRPEENAKRFQKSAKRLAMPLLPEEIFLNAVKQLVKVDHKWVPKTRGSSLYLRPFMFATDNSLSIKASENYSFCVIASPVGDYFKQRDTGIDLWVEQEFCRSGQKGTGTAKCGGNYAASLIGLNNAFAHECDQALFLDAKEGKWIEELGVMNIFFITKDEEFITPALNGNILPGITRDSILKIANSMGYKTREQAYEFSQLKKDIETKQVIEAFACGTAVIVSPIRAIKYSEGILLFNEGKIGMLSQKIRDYLIDIQTGVAEDQWSFIEQID